MKVSVATSGYGIIDLTNVFTVLANTYIENGKQISFLGSGIPDFNNSFWFGCFNLFSCSSMSNFFFLFSSLRLLI